jgi:uncharacterized membrane protein YfcA
VPPVAANATTTIALWPASFSSAIAYRQDIRTGRRSLVILLLISIAGGAVGGLLLIRTSNDQFMRLLPWLMLAAAATFTLGSQLSNRVRRLLGKPEPHRVQPAPAGVTSSSHQPDLTLPLWALAVQLIVATYGGYFGGGIGIMMLAIFAAAGMADINEMNGLKSVLAVAINGTAVLEFIAFGAVAWGPAASMIAGGIVGGYGAAFLARHLPARYVRRLILVVAWAMTAYFFVRP